MRLKKLNIQHITVANIINFLFGIFFVTKMIRSFSGSSVAGGIWNYVQIAMFLIGVVLLLSFLKYFISDLTFLILLLFTGFSMINSLIFIKFNTEDIFDFLMLAYPFCVFIIAYYISVYTCIEKNYILKLSFYIISSIFIFSMIKGGIYSTTIGAVADVYYVLGLYPLALICSKHKYVPSLICGMAVLLSGKRLGIVLFVLMVGAYYLFIAIQQKNLKRLLSLIFIIIVFFFIASNIGLNYNEYLWYRLERMIYDNDSSGRNFIWLRVVSLLKESNIKYIIFGHGDGSVTRMIGTHAHNDFLEIFYDFGFLPLVMYILFFIRCIVELIDMLKNKYENAVVFAITILFSIGVAMFSFYYIMPTYITCGMLCKGYILCDYRKKYKPEFSMLKYKQLRFKLFS